MNESLLVKNVRLQYAANNFLLWRNNVGACMDDKGNFIRYGLANESKQMNKKIKSSDLIGLRPIIITEDMVGKMLAQFVALECKAPGWIYKGTEREVAQNKFLELVNNNGGYASFITGNK